MNKQVVFYVSFLCWEQESLTENNNVWGFHSYINRTLILLIIIYQILFLNVYLEIDKKNYKPAKDGIDADFIGRSRGRGIPTVQGELCRQESVYAQSENNIADSVVIGRARSWNPSIRSSSTTICSQRRCFYFPYSGSNRWMFSWKETTLFLLKKLFPMQ